MGDNCKSTVSFSYASVVLGGLRLDHSTCSAVLGSMLHALPAFARCQLQLVGLRQR